MYEVVSVCVRARKCAFYGCEVYEKFKEYRESVRKTGGLKPVLEHAQKVREKTASPCATIREATGMN